MMDVENPTVLAEDGKLMDDLAEMEMESRRMDKKRKKKDQSKKAKRRKMDKLVGWGEQQDDQSIHQEDAQDDGQPRSQVLPVETGRLEQDIEKSLRKENVKEKPKVEATPSSSFIFNKRGSIKEDESIEMKRTHKDILEWVRKGRKKEPGGPCHLYTYI